MFASLSALPGSLVVGCSALLSVLCALSCLAREVATPGTFGSVCAPFAFPCCVWPVFSLFLASAWAFCCLPCQPLLGVVPLGQPVLGVFLVLLRRLQAVVGRLVRPGGGRVPELDLCALYVARAHARSAAWLARGSRLDVVGLCAAWWGRSFEGQVSTRVVLRVTCLAAARP